jgi:hypothetical protein
VFAEEMGARLSSAVPGHDTDPYYPFCDHLRVRELASDEVVGAYRILPPDAGRRLGWRNSTAAMPAAYCDGLVMFEPVKYFRVVPSRTVR